MLRNNMNAAFAAAGAVELTEKNTLPGSQLQLTVFKVNCCRAADQAGLDVAGRISFGMGIGKGIGHGFAQSHQDILLNRRIGIFIDGDPGGGMGDVN